MDTRTLQLEALAFASIDIASCAFEITTTRTREIRSIA